MSDPTGVIQRDPEILGGTPVFAGTRVPGLLPAVPALLAALPDVQAGTVAHVRGA